MCTWLHRGIPRPTGWRPSAPGSMRPIDLEIIIEKRDFHPPLLEPYVRRPELDFADLLRHALPAALGEGWTVDPAGGPHQRTLLCTDPWQGFVVSLVPTAIRPTWRNLWSFSVRRPWPGEECAHAVKVLRWFHRKEAIPLAKPLLCERSSRFHNPHAAFRRVRHPERALDGIQAHLVGPSAYDWLPPDDYRNAWVDQVPDFTTAQYLVMRTIWAAKLMYEVNFPGTPPLVLCPPPR